ncbi:MAG: DNA alkylation repair protein [Bacteroidales bacterium]|nr:DNA alkylation repair protein [Bacteroidales bacterium]
MYLKALDQEFQKNASLQIAIGQKAYMKNLFEFYGINSPLRAQLQKPFLQKPFLPLKSEMIFLVKELWQKPQREYQYFAQELAFKYIQQSEEKDLDLYEFMLIHKSWWDTVDYISVHLVGNYFKKYPQQIESIIPRWLKSGNKWLHRSALLFQLKYKQELDIDLLSNTILFLVGSKEFFINKAIGWVLREYSKTNPIWVQEFVDKTNLNALSRKEALRLMNR